MVLWHGALQWEPVPSLGRQRCRGLARATTLAEGDASMETPADVQSLKELLATGTGILYQHGLVDAFGHLSARLPGTDHFLINPRQSPALLRPDTVLTMTLDGEVVEAPCARTASGTSTPAFTARGPTCRASCTRTPT
jgi:hypothetical protein